MTINKTDKPKISVVMSFYKEPLRWIELSVCSILSQTFRDFELIIVCDNPQYHEAITLVRNIAGNDDRVRFIINDTNIGLTKSLNLAISLSEGDLIARMDADDIAYPGRFAGQVDFLDRNPSIDLCSSDVDVIDPDDKVIKRRRNRRKNKGKWIYMENYISHPTVMFRRELAQLRTPLYNEQFRYTQDYELWIFFLSKGVRFHSLKESLLKYRVSETNISSVHRDMQDRYFNFLHHRLITSRLCELGIIDNSDVRDIRTMLNKTSDSFSKFSGETSDELSLILYTLYFTQAVEDRKYILRYFLDMNLLFLTVRPQLSYQMLRAGISGKRKKAYLDPNVCELP